MRSSLPKIVGSPSNKTPRKEEHKSPTSKLTNTPVFAKQSNGNNLQNDINNINEIRIKFNEMKQKLEKVIADNETTPQVKKTVEPLINAVKEAIPEFLDKARDYYKTYYRIQTTTNTNQVLSTYSCRGALADFTKPWDVLCEVIDTYAEINPPPHSMEIEIKFSAIHATLELISKANDRKKHPSKTVINSIESIQALCTKLKNSIIDLFSQPTFPHFDTDLYSSFKNDIKIFTSVINHAFSNEFLSSGLMITDLTLIRSTIFTDCSEIISILKAAFAFPDEMKEIQAIKNNILIHATPTIQILSQAFSVIKPTKFIQETIDARPSPIFSPREVSARSIPSVADINAGAIEKIDDFLNRVFPKYLPGLRMSHDTWENIALFETKLDQIFADIEVVKKSVEEREKKFQDEKADHKDKQHLLKDKLNYFNEQNQMQNAEISHLKEIIKRHEEEIENLKADKENLLSQIQKLTMLGNPTYLRKSLRSLFADFSQAPSAQTDEGLMETLRNIIRKLQTCEQCEENNRYMKSLSEAMDSVYRTSAIDHLAKLNGIHKRIQFLESDIEEKISDIDMIKTKVRNAFQHITKNKPFPNSLEEMVDIIVHEFDKKARMGTGGTALGQITAITKRFSETLTRLCKKISEAMDEDSDIRLGLCISTDNEELISQTTTAIERQADDIKFNFKEHIENENNLKSKVKKARDDNMELRTQLNAKFGVTKMSAEIVEDVYKTANEWKQPYIDQANAAEDERKKIDEYLSSIYARVRGLINSHDPPAIGSDERFEAIHSLLDDLQDMHDNIVEDGQEKTEKHDRLRQFLLDLFFELRPIAGAADIDPDTILDVNLTKAVQSAARKVTAQADPESISRKTVGELFQIPLDKTVDEFLTGIAHEHAALESAADRLTEFSERRTPNRSTANTFLDKITASLESVDLVRVIRRVQEIARF